MFQILYGSIPDKELITSKQLEVLSRKKDKKRVKRANKHKG